MSPISSEQRQRDLIEAAIRVIGREGLARATTRRVAAEAGAPLASLHYAFKNKEELFLGVIEYCQRLVADWLRDHTDPQGGLEAASRALIELHYDMTRDNPEFMITQYELVFWAVRTPSAQQYAPRFYEGYFESIREILADSLADGDDPEDIERFSRYVVAVIDGMILQMIGLGGAGPTSADIPRYVLATCAAARAADPVAASAASK